MYCPECKEEFEGKFCPECGCKLIEKPAQPAAFSINLGDANAISGGINLHDSHEVHNIDNSVHNITNNTSTVNNITNVAAQKSESEILQERKLLFINAVNGAIIDGHIDAESLRLLEQERLRIGLDALAANQLIEQAKRNAAPVIHNLSPTQQLILKQIKQYIQTNNTEQLKRQLPRLEALAKNSADDEAHFLYAIVSAAVDPHRLVADYETVAADNYWKTYWTYIAYTKIGAFDKAESIPFNLSLYSQYATENMSLLLAVGAYREFGDEEAKNVLADITGAYDSYLNDFASAIYLRVDPDLADLIGARKENIDFYLDNLLEFVDEVTLREMKESEASRIYNLRLTNAGSNAFKVTMILKSGLNISLPEAKAILGCCPIDIVKSKPKDQLEDLMRKLQDGGANVSLVEV